MADGGGEMYAGGTVEGIDQFTDLVKKIADLAWGSTWGLFTSEWPTGNSPEELTMPQITYELFHRVPSKAMRTLKPRQMQTLADPDVPGAFLFVYRQWFDCLLDFGIWARTSKEAEDLKRRFEDLILSYTGFFKDQGVSELLFVAELQPSVSTKWRQDIPHRALRYLVRIERITTVRSASLNQVLTSVEAQKPDGTLTLPLVQFETPAGSSGSPLLQLYDQFYPTSPSKP